MSLSRLSLNVLPDFCQSFLQYKQSHEDPSSSYDFIPDLNLGFASSFVGLEKILASSDSKKILGIQYSIQDSGQIICLQETYYTQDMKYLKVFLSLTHF